MRSIFHEEVHKILKKRLLTFVLIIILLTNCKAEEVGIEDEDHVYPQTFVDLEGKSLQDLFPNASEKLLSDWTGLLEGAKIVTVSLVKKYYVWDKKKSKYVASNIESDNTTNQNTINLYTIVSEKTLENNKKGCLIIGSFEQNLNTSNILNLTPLLGFSLASSSNETIRSNSDTGVVHFEDRDYNVPITTVFAGLVWQNKMDNGIPSSGTFSMILNEINLNEEPKGIYSRLDIELDPRENNQFLYSLTGSQLNIDRSSDLTISNETRLD